MKVRRQPTSTDRRFKKSAIAQDYGTEERWSHSKRTFEHTDISPNPVAKSLEECVLDALHRNSSITEKERCAGLKLKSDFMAAKLSVRIISSYNPLSSEFNPFSARAERSKKEERAYKRWRGAIKRLGHEFENPVIDACCFDIVRNAGQIPRLKNGLAALAKWYDISDKKAGMRE